MTSEATRGVTSGVVVRSAGVDDLPEAARLFAGYLDSYGISHDGAAASAYLRERIATGQSLVLLAEVGGSAVGFAQVHPTWASLELAPAWVLSDLFVDPPARRRGVGRSLLRGVTVRARAAGATTAVLETAHTNTAAQALYEGEGWVRDTTYRTYALEL